MKVTPVDDSERLHRRIPAIHLKDDGTVSSAAFTDPEMSVDRAALTTLAQTLAYHPQCGIAEFVARDARSLDLAVEPDATIDNIAHALVLGKKTKSMSRKLAAASKLLLAPVAPLPETE